MKQTTSFSLPQPGIYPFWFWNGVMEESELSRQLRLFQQSGCRGAAIHCRTGNRIEYLSDRWLELCRFTVDAVGGRALTVVGSFSRGTAATLAGARYARECGADLFLPFPPNWAGSCTAGTLIDYFTAVAAEMPLLLIYPALGAVPESTTVIEEVQRRSGGRVAAVKDDLCQPISRRMTAALSGECAVFSGGQKQNFLNIRPYGAVGYLSTIGMFRPEVAREFYRALEEGNERRAVELILTVDMPFFDALLACPGSFDAGIHAVMEMYGFCSRHRRAPYYDLTDAEVEELREKIHHIGLI